MTPIDETDPLRQKILRIARDRYEQYRVDGYQELADAVYRFAHELLEAELAAPVPSLRYELARGGEAEPHLLLVVDRQEHLIVARGSDIALTHMEQLVDAANRGAGRSRPPQEEPTE